MSKQNELVQFSRGASGGGSKNLIINGGMTIDQRNSGSATTNGSSGYTTVDRWKAYDNLSAGASTAQQVTDVPDNQGFKNSLKFTVTTADSNLGTGEVLFIQQSIEGNNFSVLRYGTSSAKTLTLSFWVKSSETGTFGGSLQRSVNYDRQYGFTYAISDANTWEYKTVTIVGDTGGTWPTDNTAGASLMFNLGSGSSRLISTANQWGTTSLGFQVSGTKNIAGTVNATFFLTGVQLEVNDNATDFEHRSFGDELARCQRYFYKVQGSSSDRLGIGGYATSASEARMDVVFPCSMRAAPTISGTGTAQFDANQDSADWNCSALTIDEAPTGIVSSLGIQIGSTSSMTAGQSGGFRFRSTGTLSFSAEL